MLGSQRTRRQLVAFHACMRQCQPLVDCARSEAAGYAVCWLCRTMPPCLLPAAQFFWGGCNGNQNKFVTRLGCRKACKWAVPQAEALA